MILGSGFLSVKVSTDGPTRVLQISDVKNKVRWVVSLHMNIMFKSTNNTFFSVNARIGLSQLSCFRNSYEGQFNFCEINLMKVWVVILKINHEKKILLTL